MSHWNLEDLIKANNLTVDKIDFICSQVLGKTVLDLGCVRHDAALALMDPDWLHRKISQVAASCVGVDYLEKDVKILQQSGFNVICANVTEPLDLEEKFAVIVAADLIEHLTNFDGFFSNVKRLLAQDGRLVVSTPNPFFIDLFLFTAIKRQYLINPEHTCWIDPQALNQLLLRYSMEIERLYFVRTRYSGMRLITRSRSSDFDIFRSQWSNNGLIRRVVRVLVSAVAAPIWTSIRRCTGLSTRLTAYSDYVCVIKTI